MALEIRRLDDQAKRALSEARGLLELATQESRDLTSEEQTRFDELSSESERCVSMRERLKELEQSERRDLEATELERRTREAAARKGKADPEKGKRDYSAAFMAWARGGITALSGEQRATMERGFKPLDVAAGELGGEQRVLTGSTGGSPYGGYTVPEDFMGQVEKVMAQYGAILSAPTGKFNTSTGALMPWPTSDDTANAGELLSETSGTAAVTAGDVVFDRIVFTSYTLSSKMVKVQRQLLQDEGVNLTSFLADALGERLGRGMGSYCTVGSGSAQPTGIVTAAADADLDFSLSGTKPDYADFVDLVHAVDPAYRGQASYGLMFNDTCLVSLRKLLDTTEQPIWNPGGMANNAPPTLLGVPYWINQDMPAPTGTNKAYLVGDLSKFKIRRVQPPIMLRLEERYAELLQVAFLMFTRFDSNLVNANAVMYASVAT